VIFIARQKRNVEAVHKRSYVPQVLIGDCLFIGKSQRDKRVRELASTPDYKRSPRARYDCDACGTVAEPFYLAATAQNLKRLVRHLAQKAITGSDPVSVPGKIGFLMV
jgi:hypothetical protein